MGGLLEHFRRSLMELCEVLMAGSLSKKLDLVHIFLPKSLAADQSYKCPLFLKSVMTFFIYLKKWYSFDQVCRIV